MSEAEKIYVDASQPAVLNHSGRSVDCPTLQEAVLEWHRLAPDIQRQATIGEADAYKLWHQLSDERNRYLENVDVELIGRAKSGHSETPREAYISRSVSAAATAGQERLEQLCDEEVEATLREIRGFDR